MLCIKCKVVNYDDTNDNDDGDDDNGGDESYIFLTSLTTRLKNQSM